MAESLGVTFVQEDPLSSRLNSTPGRNGAGTSRLEMSPPQIHTLFAATRILLSRRLSPSCSRTTPLRSLWMTKPDAPTAQTDPSGVHAMLDRLGVSTNCPARSISSSREKEIKPISVANQPE